MVMIVRVDGRSGSSPAGRSSVDRSFLPRHVIVLQQDICCYRGIRCRQIQRRARNKCSMNPDIRSLDINICGLHGLGTTGQHSVGNFWLGLTPTVTAMFDV